MANNTKKRKTTNSKKFKLPPVSVPDVLRKALPYNGKVIKESGFSFSFSCFDRSHKLFNLGCDGDSIVSVPWFIELMDCFKSVNSMTFTEVCQSLHDLHRVDWEQTNTTAPQGSADLEYWQFRLNKAKGRVIGFLIDSVFYVVWLDANHNLVDSEGYGKATFYKPGLSLYEIQENEIQKLKSENSRLKKEADFFWENL